MKNLKSKFAVIVFVSFLTLLSFAAQAQVGLPYRFSNGTQCPITISWTVYNGPAGACTSVICTTGGGTVPPSGGTLTIPATFCSTACQIDITIAGITYSYPFPNHGPTPTNAVCNGQPVLLYLNSGNNCIIGH